MSCRKDQARFLRPVVPRDCLSRIPRKVSDEETRSSSVKADAEDQPLQSLFSGSLALSPRGDEATGRPYEIERTQYRRYATGTVLAPDFRPKHGQTGAEARIRYNLYGADGLPVVVVLGGISASRDVAASAEERRTGWWNALVGAGRAVDLCRYRVLSIDYLTGFGGKGTGIVSTEDQAQALAAVLEGLGIREVAALIGASYGAMVGFAFAACHPQNLKKLVAISGADCAHPLATAFRALQRRMVRFGLEHGAPAEGLVLARSLGLATYWSHGEFARRFPAGARFEDGRMQSEVEDFLATQARNYSTRVSPEAFLRLSESLDLHEVDPSRIHVPVTLVAADPDLLVPLDQMRALAARLAERGRLFVLESPYGHDAFLHEPEKLGPILHHALEEGSSHALPA